MTQNSIHPLLTAALDLVGLCDYITFDITLTYDGQVIKGRLIGESVYRERVGKQWKSTDFTELMRKYPNGAPHPLSEQVRAFESAIRTESTNWPESAAGQSLSHDFIHIADVTGSFEASVWRVPSALVTGCYISNIAIRDA